MRPIPLTGAAALLTHGACGRTDTERARSGAAIGGVAARVLDQDVVTGAAVGAAAGARADDLGLVR